MAVHVKNGVIKATTVPTSRRGCGVWCEAQDTARLAAGSLGEGAPLLLHPSSPHLQDEGPHGDLAVGAAAAAHHLQALDHHGGAAHGQQAAHEDALSSVEGGRGAAAVAVVLWWCPCETGVGDSCAAALRSQCYRRDQAHGRERGCNCGYGRVCPPRHTHTHTHTHPRTCPGGAPAAAATSPPMSASSRICSVPPVV